MRGGTSLALRRSRDLGLDAAEGVSSDARRIAEDGVQEVERAGGGQLQIRVGKGVDYGDAVVVGLHVREHIEHALDNLRNKRRKGVVAGKELDHARGERYADDVCTRRWPPQQLDRGLDKERPHRLLQDKDISCEDRVVARRQSR
ncbi:uncharacterized protein AMSG_11682 [Thecamonas trahens ATCC 50062]|uniref:Uncharacterized protein n=1 Tax=Thecamonas trahens ATCC 50062 TaxID=461836 RepID=A0A0L0DUV4_THETB|nr:hypothetical protein AMSG_11682 [Thecamonas trahens ATCC 50062]KNC55982.1 hypothetical protein AMSG_11682 [Thecamonas trahens ATCC 50062]|eukprot:XP_013761221.1 hypothetical protein AMSG_11682 [Thecamonas trahens ATCC 50062]